MRCENAWTPGEDTPGADMYQLYRAADRTSPPAPAIAQAVTPTAASWCEECSSHARAAVREPQARHSNAVRPVPGRDAVRQKSRLKLIVRQLGSTTRPRSNGCAHLP